MNDEPDEGAFANALAIDREHVRKLRASGGCIRKLGIVHVLPCAFQLQEVGVRNINRRLR